ncbi:hypothetical protein GIY30_00630 [Gordonia sp. HNM0687]|uniref:DUF4878 domain-containing protein n=1 Tax=Gordonia mangrovi TaxID=2665643 RepID=A0A6L7GIV3_9ACTN|nr:hypothetical protein [Gordonia mangrovi]MXP19869.1 hypothetical protein [Gordonia mangrovi]UVF79508.1 hypothetical protein NWF22_06620 [Gordonia mangrovi]
MAKRADDQGRSESGGRSDDQMTPAPSWKAAWPFLVALGLVVVAAVGISISYLIRPADDRMSTEAHIQHAVNDVYTARNELDYTRYREATCAAELASDSFPDEDTFVEQNRVSFEENGQIVIPEISEIDVNGDRATAQVHWHFDETPDSEQVTDVVVVREDGDWKVCTS